MKKEEKMVSALLAVFPSPESFIRFTADDDNYKALRSLLLVAHKHGIIPNAEQTLLLDFIRANAVFNAEYQLPEEMTFQHFFEQKEKILELNLSLRALTEHINALLKGNKIQLPKVTNSMLSRLKKESADTPHKQNVLRSLAFWIGYYRGHLISRWNFESLSMLCHSSTRNMEPKAGVRIGFSLTGRGDKIDLEIIEWLKNTIKDYIGKSLEQFSYGSWGKVRFLDITTLHVDFPREKPLNSPLNYRQCIRSAISLSHQIALRWALTPFCSQNRFLAIGIAAGNFASLDRHLRVTLETKLAGDPVIRLTDFARQCVLVNEIRAALCAKPEEMTLHNGENLNIWWVVGVWSTIYFDFVPEMLDDPLLGNKTDAAQELFNQLLGNLSHNQSGLVKEKSNAVVAFFRSPHNTMLGMEIAKVLYYRRRFWDAIQILKILLSLNDDHIHARSLLMVLYRSLALSAPKIQIAERLFKQARKEADYILANCEYQSEDFYCEYAVIFLAKAMLMLKELRLRSDPNEQHCEVRQAKKNIFAALSKAEDLFETAIMVSPSGIRAHYLRNSVALIKCILKNDEKIFTDRHRPLDGSPDTIRQMNIDNQWQYGFLREDIPEAYPYESMEKIFNAFFHSHDDSIALEAYRPTIYFCSAVSWWDLFPLRTVGTAKRVIQLLKEALSIADAMDAKGLCIYSFTRTYGEMLPAKEFMEHLTKAIEMVYSYCSGYLDQRDNLKVIKPANPKRAALLTTLNFP